MTSPVVKAVFGAVDLDTRHVGAAAAQQAEESLGRACTCIVGVEHDLVLDLLRRGAGAAHDGCPDGMRDLVSSPARCNWLPKALQVRWSVKTRTLLCRANISPDHRLGSLQGLAGRLADPTRRRKPLAFSDRPHLPKRAGGARGYASTGRCEPAVQGNAVKATVKATRRPPRHAPGSLAR